MKTRLVLLLALVSAGAPSLRAAVPLAESTFVQVVNDVKVVPSGGGEGRPAKVTEVFRAPEIIRTGAKSRAELRAPDDTLTRVGANSAFSFESAGRTINLEKGSVLFHSPAGRGGGTIKSAGASASVLGTTLIVSATADGGFKVIALEGKVRVQLPGGVNRVLQGGEMTFVTPGGKEGGPVVKVNVDKMALNSNLIRGFDQPLPSMGRIDQVIKQQVRMMNSGRASDTGVLIGTRGLGTGTGDPQVGQIAVNHQVISQLPSQILPPQDRDATISGPNLRGEHLLGPFIFGRPGLNEDVYGGYVGRNLTLNTPQINLSDLGGPVIPDTLPTFDLLAVHQININRDVEFLGRGEDQPDRETELRLVAGDTVRTTPGISLRYDNPATFSILSGDSASYSGLTMQNAEGNVRIESRAGSLTLEPSAAGGQGLKPTQLLANRTVQALAGEDLNLIGARLQGSQITLSAGGALTADGATFQAPPSRSLQSITMEARTIILQNVQLPGAGTTVNLRSLNGQLAENPNTGAAVRPGYVNFIRNVTVAGQPAQNFVRTPGNPGGHIVLSPLPNRR